MLEIPDNEVLDALREENPWWQPGGEVDALTRALPRRAYLASFSELVRQTGVQRAVVLMGPRRVGKSVLVHHCIHELLTQHGVQGRDVLYVMLDRPIYAQLSLHDLVARFRQLFRRPEGQLLYIFFDEIQYLDDWEVHLKALVDQHRDLRLVATGSSAAALKRRSRESGAGRFTDFTLPPLTFAEYLRFIGREDELVHAEDGAGLPRYTAPHITALNAAFVDYLNQGGYPEAVANPLVAADPQRYIKSDIIDKVLLRDLPTLYGITDIQELNRLFTTLAYHTSREITIEELSKTSNVARNTLIKYMDYLEAAFLVRHMRRVDEDAAHFKRKATFKVFLTNPTMRSALFKPLRMGHELLPLLVETAVFAQWIHNRDFIDSLHYARWKSGEVDLVSLDPMGRPRFAVEVKWTDATPDDPRPLKGLVAFCKKHPLPRPPLVTTITRTGRITYLGQEIEFVPASLHCYTVGKNTLERSVRY